MKTFIKKMKTCTALLFLCLLVLNSCKKTSIIETDDLQVSKFEKFKEEIRETINKEGYEQKVVLNQQHNNIYVP